MPKITITEIDSTGVGIEETSNNTVFIPGHKSANDGSAEEHSFVLCTTVDEFEKYLGKKAPKTGTEDESGESDNLYDKSWIMAHQLLKLGLPILYYVLGENETFKNVPWARLSDRALFDIRFITLGCDTLAETDLSGDTVIKPIIEAVKSRGDCVLLLDHPMNVTSVEEGSGTTSVNGYFKKIKTAYVGNGTSDVIKEKTEHLKYCSGFTPWCTFKGICRDEGINPVHEEEEIKFETEIKLPASFGYMSAYAKSIKEHESWFAAAGSFRGLIPFTFEPNVIYGDADVNILETRDSGHVTVNPICLIRPFGYIIWGNRTMLPTVDDTESVGGLKASHSLNVRQLCCDLKKELYRVSKKFTFEQNDDILWVNFQAELKPLLDRMLSGRGIKGYRIIKIKTNKKATLSARVRVVPIEAVEDFDLFIELADTIEVVEA